MGIETFLLYLNTWQKMLSMTNIHKYLDYEMNVSMHMGILELDYE